LAKRGEDYEATIARKIREKRGLGELSTYKPWLDIRDVSSLGRSHILLGATTGREHHLLSDLEEYVCLYADYSPTVIDICEQFPLFSREETAAIAEEIDVKHPAHSGSNDVLTEDFLFSLAGPSRRWVARQVKYVSDLQDLRVLSKLEIQKRYFERRGVDWRIITERDVSPVLKRNLKWLRRGVFETFDEEVIRKFGWWMGHAKSTDTLDVAIRRSAKSVDLLRGEATLLFKQLVWNHTIEVDISVPLDLSIPLSTLKLCVQREGVAHAKSA
jgi:hypothetical protein